MLTSSSNQYLRPEYLTPLPTTVSYLIRIYMLVFACVLLDLTIITLASEELNFCLFAARRQEKSVSSPGTDVQPDRGRRAEQQAATKCRKGQQILEIRRIKG